MTRINQMIGNYTKDYLASYISHRYKKLENGCWKWQHAIDEKGYGRIRIPTGNRNRLSIRANRLAAYIWLDFDLDPNKQICHRCNNPSCINPEHLYIGTNSSNQLDSVGTGKKSFYKTRTHCSRGHEFTVQNTRYHNDSKVCRICRNENARRRNEEKRNSTGLKANLSAS